MPVSPAKTLPNPDNHTLLMIDHQFTYHTHRSRFSFCTPSKIVLALFCFVTLFAAGTIAKAQSASFVYMNITNSGSNDQMNQYQLLVQSLRNAAGFTYRNTAMMTQGTSSEQSANLIRLQLTDVTEGRNNPALQLWFTADNLYLRGFTNILGQTFFFTEGQYNLGVAFDNVFGYQSGPATNMVNLAYSSNYNSLTTRAGVGRENLNLSYDSFYNAFYNLLYATSSQRTSPNYARSLLLMIQYFSEAARFWDVYGFVSSQVNYTANSTTLPLFQQYLENSWAQISQFGININQNPSTPPVTVNGIDPSNNGSSVTLYNWGDVQARMAVLLNQDEIYDPNMGGYSGDWNHDEL